jgi:peroxiredoxin
VKPFSLVAASVVILLLGCHPALSQSTNSLPDAGIAWEELLQATNRPPLPKEWKTHKPTQDQLRQYYLHTIDVALAAAGKAETFYKQFPDSTNAGNARILEEKMRQRAIVYDRLIHKFNVAVGKPLDIKFTSTDGRVVDLTDIKGKVVLVYFWATWCGPCVGEIPNVKEAYNKFHPRGFDIVGISLDNDENAFNKFVQAHGLPWPQYFDGLSWTNKFSVQYGIESIPTMWLVDKSGNLCVTNVRDDLQGQVEKLLAE